MIIFNKVYFEEVDSTMDVIKNYPLNTIIIASKQTKGRGKNNRIWTSEKSNNLYMSLKIKDCGEQSFNYIFSSSLIILKTLKYFFKEIDIKLKWPNDILVNEKKVAGILIERDVKEQFLIIGIGVNIDKFPDNATFQATSLKDENFIINKEEFLNIFSDLFSKFSNTLNFEDTIKEWLEYAYNIKKNINVKISDDNIINGIFETVDKNGNLILNCDGNIKKIFTGDVFK